MELTTSKTRIVGLAAAILLATAFPVEAQSSLDNDEWLHKNYFGLAEGYYTSLADFTGGGVAAGGDYVNGVVPWGIGGKAHLSLMFHDFDDWEPDADGSDVFFGADIYLLARAMDVVTIYGGCGIIVHSLDFEYDDTSRTCDGTGTTSNVFAGIRWVFAGHCYVFAEYRREFGEVEVEESYYSTRGWRRITTKKKIDLSDNRVVIGLGGLF